MQNKKYKRLKPLSWWISLDLETSLVHGGGIVEIINFTKFPQGVG